MTSLQPRPPYSDEELSKLYPKGLQLQLVQILLRHGERTPVSGRFQNAGLSPYWPYCTAAQKLYSVVRVPLKSGEEWNHLKWRRRLETFGLEDEPVAAEGPNRNTDNICNLGELTDRGRETTFALGARLRHLYVEQLGFMPRLISDADMFYLRATPIPRALESLQQAFWGMYPLSTRTKDFPTPTIVTRSPADETLWPNESNCRRLSQLSRAFAQRAADRWNGSPDMKYLSNLLSKWMPDNAPVAVDSHPRLSGILDTVNSTRAHGPSTRLPKEFYNPKAMSIMEKIAIEEWNYGYSKSQEYRLLGVGSLMGDIVSRMMGSVEGHGHDGLGVSSGQNDENALGRGGETGIKFALSGCHDTTLASIMACVGAYTGENAVWPPYTSHIAVELFKNPNEVRENKPSNPAPKNTSKSWSFPNIFGGTEASRSTGIFVRKPTSELSEAEKQSMKGHYVRLRFNDRVLKVPGCAVTGNHLQGDESFCTLAAFKEIVDKFTPHHWKASCLSNLEESPFPTKPEDAGF